MTSPRDQIAKAGLFRSPLPAATQISTVAARPPLMLGGLEIPSNLETRHLLALGTTGAGKSVAISSLLAQCRDGRPSDPAILVDHSCELFQKFYRPGDVFFSPFDARSVGWSWANEIEMDFDFDGLANAFIPKVQGENAQFYTAAALLLSDIMRALFVAYSNDRSQLTNAEMLRVCNRVPMYESSRNKDGESLEGLLKDSNSSGRFDPGNNRGLAISKDIISQSVKVLQYVPDGDFSIRRFVAGFAHGEKRWLFLGYTDRSYAAIKAIFGVLVGSAIQAGLDLPVSSTRRFYLVLDELPSLGKIEGLDDAMVKTRKRGGVLVLGAQSFSQIEEIYGKCGAQTLMSCTGTQLLLRVADAETAETASRLVGDKEDWQASHTSGTSTGREQSSSSGTSTAQVIKRLVLPAEFMGFPDLTGILKVAGHKIRKISLSVDHYARFPSTGATEVRRAGVTVSGPEWFALNTAGARARSTDMQASELDWPTGQ